MGQHRQNAIEMAMNLAAGRGRGPPGPPPGGAPPARNPEGGIPSKRDAPPPPQEPPVIYDTGAVPVGGSAPTEVGQDVAENKTFAPYGQWKTVKKKLTQEEKADKKTGNERDKYGIVVNKLPQKREEEEEEKVSKGDMAGMGVLGSTLGKRGLDTGEDEASFKAVSFKKPKAFRRKSKDAGYS